MNLLLIHIKNNIFNNYIFILMNAYVYFYKCYGFAIVYKF